MWEGTFRLDFAGGLAIVGDCFGWEPFDFFRLLILLDWIIWKDKDNMC